MVFRPTFLPRLLLLAPLVVAGCRGDDDPPAARDDGGAPGPDAAPTPDDAGVDAGPPCEDVCFAWAPRPPRDLDAPPTPGAVRVPTVCNPYGLEGGHCPDGYTCAERGEDAAPVCEPEDANAIVWDTATDGDVDGVSVRLRLRLNDAPWPATDVPDATAGQVFLRRWGAPDRFLDLPTDGTGVVDVALPPGVYELMLSTTAASLDGTRYPAGLSRWGTLTVVGAGAVDVPQRGVEVPWRVQLDGAALGALGDTEWVSLRFHGALGTTATTAALAGTVAEGVIMLEPDAYHGVLVPHLAREGHVLGGATAPTPFTVPAGGLASPVDVAIDTVEVGGVVTVDGVPLADPAGAARLRLDAPGATLFLPLDPATGAYAARIAARPYAVVLDTWATDVDGVPRAASLLRTEAPIDGAGDLGDLALTTRVVEGTVTSNGGPLPDGVTAGVSFGCPGERDAVRVWSADGVVAARVFEGVAYDVVVRGVGPQDAFPQAATTLQRGYEASAAALDLDVVWHPVTLTIRHGGVAPADAPPGARRGSVQLHRALDPGLTGFEPQFMSLSQTGALTGTVALRGGRWSVVYRHLDTDYQGVGLGIADLGSIDVDGPVDRTLDIASVPFRGTVAHAGDDLPEAAHRGTLRVYPATGGGFNVDLSTEGSATFEVPFLEGVYSFMYDCPSAHGCDTELLGVPGRAWLTQRVAVRP